MVLDDVIVEEDNDDEYDKSLDDDEYDADKEEDKGEPEDITHEEMHKVQLLEEQGDNAPPIDKNAREDYPIVSSLSVPPKKAGKELQVSTKTPRSVATKKQRGRGANKAARESGCYNNDHLAVSVVSITTGYEDFALPLPNPSTDTNVLTDACGGYVLWPSKWVRSSDERRTASALVHDTSVGFGVGSRHRRRLRRWFTAPASALALVHGSGVGFGVGSRHRRCFTAAASAPASASAIILGISSFYSDSVGHHLSEVRFDLLRNGILQSYIVWDKHGEDYNDVSLESEANTDCDGDVDEEMLDRGDDDHSEEAQEPSGEAARFYRLLQDYKDPLVVDGSKVSKYMDGMTTKFNRQSRNDDGHDDVSSTRGVDIFTPKGRPLGKPTPYHLDLEEYEQVHLYALHNCDELLKLVKEHKNKLAVENPAPRSIERRHKAEFADWVRKRVELMYKEGSIPEDIYYLVCGPLRSVRHYSGYIVNGSRFHTIDRQENRKTQIGGLMVQGDDESQKKYYGVLKDVYELQYPGENHVIVFKCDWYDVQHQGRGYKIDEYGITSLSKELSLATYEPFVLESQAEQVFYVPEPRDKSWVAVIKTEPQDLYNILESNIDENALEEVHNEAVQQECNRVSNLYTSPPEHGGYGGDIRLDMVGRGQAKIRKNVGRENGKTQSVADMENIQNVLRDSINVDEIGSTTNSPDHHEDIAIDNRLQPLGRDKQKYGSKFASRLQICLNAHEAVDPPPSHANDVDENQPKKTESNGNVLPEPDVVWLAEHTNVDGDGVLKWVKDGRSKEIHLVKDKDKEPEGDQSRPQTQEEMLLHVLDPKSGYSRGKGTGYRTSAKARLQEQQQQVMQKQQEEQQQIMQKQQDQIMNLQSELEASKKAIDDYKEEQRLYMEAVEKRFEDMITRRSMIVYNLMSFLDIQDNITLFFLYLTS
ncbi:hypothetical protein BVRB_7g164130 [Beta vulgaris subsp. vulgaris]|nr:hypothetical protein BVRB_7g164130 [Beta vulgaris subsp. vulgaris]